jgi:hypothetical protein
VGFIGSEKVEIMLFNGVVCVGGLSENINENAA